MLTSWVAEHLLQLSEAYGSICHDKFLTKTNINLQNLPKDWHVNQYEETRLKTSSTF